MKIKQVLVFLFPVVLLFSSCSSDSTIATTTIAEETGTVNGYKIEPDANLAGAKLASADLNFVDLSGANLSNADLSQAGLWNANLERANLTGADLSNADLTGARLLGANLTGAKLADAHMADTNFLGAIGMTDEDLMWAKLEGAVLPDGTIN